MPRFFDTQISQRKLLVPRFFLQRSLVPRFIVSRLLIPRFYGFRVIWTIIQINDIVASNNTITLFSQIQIILKVIYFHAALHLIPKSHALDNFIQFLQNSGKEHNKHDMKERKKIFRSYLKKSHSYEEKEWAVSLKQLFVKSSLPCSVMIRRLLCRVLLESANLRVDKLGVERIA